LKISKQISDRYPFTINADQTEIHFTLNQNTVGILEKWLMEYSRELGRRTPSAHSAGE
jgi:hypothetical protein